MAIQLAAATLTGFAVARWLDKDHLVWPVLTILVVHSGNRSRGDVLWKGTQRIIGALVGTGIATIAAGALAPGDSSAIVIVFAILIVASGLRSIGYVFWAAGITSALAFLYGYFGQTPANLLVHRLGGILIGGIIGVLAAWLILPIRTTDLVRLRLSQLLAAITELAHAMSQDADTAAQRTQLNNADRELALLEPTARAAKHLGLGPARQLATAIAQARHLIPKSPINQAALSALAHEASKARQSLTTPNSPPDQSRPRPSRPRTPHPRSQRPDP